MAKENNQSQIDDLKEELKTANADRSFGDRYFMLSGDMLKYLMAGSFVVGAFMARAFLRNYR